MNRWVYWVLPITLTACTAETDIDKAPYAAVNEPDAPTVASLEATGYGRADYYPVGCIIPEQPEAMCDATGAEFMDRSEATYEDYGQYEYVCPAIDSVELAEWKCRKQLQSVS
ncbi:hypothetical protein [Sphingopyxis sp. H115]|uniref:hypothetical protein n=1 Tax=Sphingopyxis sp. H115 TaxID=1759073 RepID=UPI000AB3F1E5|nr:hypothetical protein [Sphingopyxis sp. H115]